MKENIKMEIHSSFPDFAILDDISSISFENYQLSWKDKIRYQIQDYLSQLSISQFQTSILFPILILFFVLYFLYKIFIFVLIEKKRYEEVI
jgi:hypothetical protein